MVIAAFKRTSLALVLAWLFSVNAFAQPLAVATRYITPEEVVPDSVQLFHFSTNTFGVRWTYTEAGASNMLAFQEAHDGQKVRTIIGSFESPVTDASLPVANPDNANYKLWKEGWLKRRTDKFLVSSEADAPKIVAGLKRVPPPATGVK